MSMESTVPCPFCNIKVLRSQLEWHANSHFEDEEDHQIANDRQLALQFSSSSSLNNGAEATSPKSQTDGGDGGEDSIHVDDKISCLMALQMRSSFYDVKEGLMPLLKRCLELELESHKSVTVLSGVVNHFQSTVSEDIGWGCGWRNIQMLCSHLLTQRADARQVLFGGCGFVPDIPSLQRWLEIAWERGFDELGSNHFNKKIYGSTNWIGTTECAALLRSFGIRARIVDFGPKELKSLYFSVRGAKRKAVQVYGPMDRYLHPRKHPQEQNFSDPSVCEYTDNLLINDFTSNTDRQRILAHWVWNYFTDKSLLSSESAFPRVIVSDIAPLYFQHDGHSRTIVGIQKHQRDGKHYYTLLILDPAHKTAALERSLNENSGWQKFIKRGMHTLQKLQYQLCYVDRGIAGGVEVEQLKTIDSIFCEL
ncbi:zinc finger with UFM1-specific peptidase domain protein isoform X2 [Carica papaya]|uniref:zinc finger with UFM1-specific peptidase domain protein isoform X2 n=1 Tax=Carica papaya TaxID=3649 RepID=UPI000B8CE9B0|nr:zinc finger with UFM1-specific peptidase domain protein isoform X2 [Carica papaya]